MIPSFEIQFNKHHTYGSEVVRVVYIPEKRVWHFSAGSFAYKAELECAHFEEGVERFSIKLAGVRKYHYCHRCHGVAMDLTGRDVEQHEQDKLRMLHVCWWGAELDAYSVCNQGEGIT